MADATLQESNSLPFLGFKFFADVKWDIYIETITKSVLCVALDNFSH